MVLWPAFETGVFGQNTPGLIGLNIKTRLFAPSYWASLIQMMWSLNMFLSPGDKNPRKLFSVTENEICCTYDDCFRPSHSISSSNRSLVKSSSPRSLLHCPLHPTGGERTIVSHQLQLLDDTTTRSVGTADWR